MTYRIRAHSCKLQKAVADADNRLDCIPKSKVYLLVSACVTKLFCYAVKGCEDVLACLEVVEGTLHLSGWPSIPEAVLQVSIKLVIAPSCRNLLKSIKHSCSIYSFACCCVLLL